MEQKKMVTFKGQNAEVQAELPGLIILKLADGTICGADPKSVKPLKEKEAKEKAKSNRRWTIGTVAVALVVVLVMFFS